MRMHGRLCMAKVAVQPSKYIRYDEKLPLMLNQLRAAGEPKHMHTDVHVRMHMGVCQPTHAAPEISSGGQAVSLPAR